MNMDVDTFSDQPAETCFFDRIQNFFIRATGRSVLFGGRDLELLSRWKQHNIPPGIICRGIAQTVQNARSDTPPKTISACETDIRAHIQRWRDNQIQRGQSPESAEASPGPGGQSESIPDAKSAPVKNLLARGIRKFNREALCAAYRQILRRLQQNAASEPPELQYVAALEDELIERFFSALTEEEQSELDESLRNSTRRAKLEKMSSVAQREHRKAERRKLLKRKFGYISLFDAV